MAPLVDTTAGRLEGAGHKGIAVFHGIPYAAPPVGPLRFAAPAPPAPWAGARDATAFGPIAPQLPSALERLFGAKEAAQSEDCLTLNVYTPGCDAARRPVMVWVHGGAFTAGSAATPWYSGSVLARDHDVVVVTINYRLGVFGFTALADSGDALAASTNAGLLDQVAALGWVRDNIAGLGGDPANVTVFGESAGGCSVVALLGMPAARGLFHKAIAQSPSCGQLRSADEARERADALLRHLGVTRDRAGELQAMPTERLVAAQRAVLGTGGDFRAFSPAVDPATLPVGPLEAIASGAAAGVPVLTGTTKDELKLFAVWDESLRSMDDARLVRRLGARFGPRARAVADTYLAARADPVDAALAVGADETFRIPAIRVAEAQQAHGTPAYMYLFGWETPVMGGALGSCHALEIPFVFANTHQAGVKLFVGDGPEVAELARAMSTAWATFARTGAPGAVGSEAWHAYDVRERATMWFDATTKLTHDPYGAERATWEGVALP